jgi:DNA-binding response OmpR family regulator
MSKSRILVVDDDPRLVRLLREVLTAAGYDILVNSNGEHAVETIAVEQPDLVILDIILREGMDGYQVARSVREFSNVPVIMLTAKVTEMDMLTGFDVGADDYITKPFSAKELLARVRAVLRRAERQDTGDFHQPVFEHHELRIDLPRAQVACAGREIMLTATEYRLLQTLAASIGRVLTSEDLLTNVWGPEYREDKEILWVCLSRLRQKIEPDPKNPIHIVTKQGLGYLMPPLESG